MNKPATIWRPGVLHARVLRSPLFWRALLFFCLSLKLGLSTLIFLQPSNAFYPDSYGYEDLALNLIRNGSFTVPDEPALGVLRTPGYPVFIAILYTVAGRVPGFVILAQLLLSGLTALLVWQIGKEAFSEPVGLLAAFVYLVSLNATGLALYLLSDTLFTFLVILALYFLIRSRSARPILLSALSGLCLAIASLVRPIGLYLAPVWLIILVVSQARAIKPRLPSLLAFFLAYAIGVAPWMMRNYGLAGRPILSTAEAWNAYCCFAPAALAEDQGITFEQAHDRVDAPYRLDLNRESPQRLFTAADAAMQIVAQHPIGYAKAHLKGMMGTLFEPTYKQWLQLLGLKYSGSGAVGRLLALDFRGFFAGLGEGASLSLSIPILDLLYTIALYLFATIGLVQLYRLALGNHATALLAGILAITIIYLIVAPGPGGGLRFRVPAEPLLALLAAVGLTYNRLNPYVVLSNDSI